GDKGNGVVPCASIDDEMIEIAEKAILTDVALVHNPAIFAKVINPEVVVARGAGEHVVAGGVDSNGWLGQARPAGLSLDGCNRHLRIGARGGGDIGTRCG